MKPDIKDFFFALISTGATLHLEGKIIKATGLTLGADKEGITVCRAGSSIHPENYGFIAKKVGKEILFNPI